MTAHPARSHSTTAISGRFTRVSIADAAGSNERGLEHDAAVDEARGLREQARGRRRDLGTFRKLAEQIDQASHRTDEVAFVAAERLAHDGQPIVLAGGPAEDGRHEAWMHGDRHAEVTRALRLPHAAGALQEWVEPPLELGAFLQKGARQLRLPGPGLLEQR